MESTYHFTYKTTNTLNDKIYIGVHSTDNLNDGYMGSGTLLKRAFKKYGKEYFKTEILEFFETRTEAFEKEFYIVDSTFVGLNYTYNLTTGGLGASYGENNPMYGKEHSEETKQKIGKANKGKLLGENNPNYQIERDDEWRANMSKIHKGKTISEEHKKASSEFMTGRYLGDKNPMFGRTGRKNPNYGKKMSEDQKKKISKSRKGKYKGLFNPMFGKTHTDETKEKISESRKGIKLSDEHIQSIVEANTGSNNYYAKAVKNIESGKTYECIKDAAKDMGVNYSTLKWRLNSNARTNTLQYI